MTAVRYKTQYHHAFDAYMKPMEPDAVNHDNAPGVASFTFPVY
jgi:hypothetical protein